MDVIIALLVVVCLGSVTANDLIGSGEPPSCCSHDNTVPLSILWSTDFSTTFLSFARFGLRPRLDLFFSGLSCFCCAGGGIAISESLPAGTVSGGVLLTDG